MNVTTGVVSMPVFLCLRAHVTTAGIVMTSSLIWVLIAVYVGFFVFLQKVMKES